MSLDINIYSIKSTYNFENGDYSILFTRVGRYLHNEELAEKLQEIGDHEWHLGSECGYICELNGDQLADILNQHLNLNNEEETEIKEILSKISEYNEDFYRITMSY